MKAKWDRVQPGEYRWGEAGYGVTIRREATTFAYPRGASNPRWRVYLDGREKRVGQRATLAEAKRLAEHTITMNQEN
jgi:hypothetical protein